MDAAKHSPQAKPSQWSGGRLGRRNFSRNRRPKRPPLHKNLDVTTSHLMGRTQITITIDEQALADVDRLIRNGVYADRSQAIESAVKERIEKLG
ncbi:MAG TPA: ribbon-helix-helix domain-containing protein, partial [Thermoanaerobaculia bacterium]|nr:ribbon-helix-helix domain-containing protein [Thermoanaerobaculia bacterium]